ncbi:hypothetical protein C2G38_2175608 [Gigaspora rosea]|uniref:Uncharacterized protein n=1 Tax=Gigaspora rosea TaxID=44941 RepID=A0A397VIG7_9GLOM|nr:hypothetical protein C2G38_2175608 [Gigaspora rosea]
MCCSNIDYNSNSTPHLSGLSSIQQTTYTILHLITQALIQAFDTPAYSPNDGLVSVKSAQWGKYMGTVECDHWDLTNRWKLKIGSSFDSVEFYLNVTTFLATECY